MYLPANCWLKAATFLSYPSPSLVPWPWTRSSTSGPEGAAPWLGLSGLVWAPQATSQGRVAPPARRAPAARKAPRLLRIPYPVLTSII